MARFNNGSPGDVPQPGDSFTDIPEGTAAMEGDEEDNGAGGETEGLASESDADISSGIPRKGTSARPMGQNGSRLSPGTPHMALI